MSVAPPHRDERLTRISVRRALADHKRAKAQQREHEHQSAEARRLALEINDGIVQELVLVQTTLALGCGWEEGLEIVSRALATARRLATDLLGEGPVEPGDLVRSRAAGALSLEAVPLDGPRP